MRLSGSALIHDKIGNEHIRIPKLRLIRGE